MPRPSSGRPGRSGRPGARRLPTVAETSAGGLVVRHRAADDRPGAAPAAPLAQVALIGRRTRHGSLEWVLPKGHVEPGESAAEAAVREVEEETGIRGRVLSSLGAIDYWFVLDGRRIHKTVHHFLMEAVGGELSRADDEVEDVEWVPLTEAPRKLAHPDERSLAERAAAALADQGRTAGSREPQV